LKPNETSSHKKLIDALKIPLKAGFSVISQFLPVDEIVSKFIPVGRFPFNFII